MANASTAFPAGLTVRRRRLLRQALQLCEELHADRAWWRRAGGRLLAYEGPAREEARALAGLVAERCVKYPAFFDAALDHLNDAGDPSLDDAVAAMLVPLCHRERFVAFDAEGNALAARLADWWRRQPFA